MKEEIKVRNVFGEELDVLLEGNEKAKEIIIFVHGFGTDKNEGFSSFVDISKAFQENYLIIRYDASGYGKSEGEENEFQFQKSAGDLDFIIRYARRNYPNKAINIFAHSLGTFVVCLLSPYGIKRTVFTGAINLDLKLITSKLEKRILSKGGKVNKDSLSYYPRTSGETQVIGRDFWRTLENVDMKMLLDEYSEKSRVVAYKSKDDEIVGSDCSFDEYRKIKTLKYYEIKGDHNFSNPMDRNNLIKEVKAFLNGK